MATVDERSLGVARLYARAMLAVAEEQGAAESLENELEALLAQADGDEEFGDFLSSPILERDKRRVSIEAMLRGHASDLLVDSLQVINKKDRLSILAQILEAYRGELRDLRGQVAVKVHSAVELNDEQRATMIERASSFTGRQAFLLEDVNPELLGGLVVQIGDQKVDMSVRRDLELMSSRFAARLSEELLVASDFGSAGELEGVAAASHDGREEE